MYVTINTIVLDDELEKLKKAIISAAEADVDALIVQNMGVARLAHRLVPDLALHASTQMSIHTASGAKALYEMGFKRVVLAREMSKIEIEKCCEIPVELEVFVHGALCMCVSGQCYLSAMIGARSGNRGSCAQPCRLPFSVNNQNFWQMNGRKMPFRQDTLRLLRSLRRQLHCQSFPPEQVFLSFSFLIFIKQRELRHWNITEKFFITQFLFCFFSLV